MRVNFSTFQEVRPFPWTEILNQGEYWLTKYGEKIPIEEMTTEHIQNCLRYVRAAARQIENQIWTLLMTVRGEMAEWSLEVEQSRYEHWEELPLYEALVAELNKRGIEVRYNGR